MNQLYMGRRVFRWTLLSEGRPAISKGGRKRPRWFCRCDCGSEKLVLEQSLTLALRSKTGGSRSCGCLRTERSIRHGHNRHCRPSAEYTAWIAAKKRCFNPRNPSYRNYGKRGIRMCPEWAGSFEVFLRDVGPKPDPTYSLDRINPDGNYEPENCRWAPMSVQARNKRNTRWYEFHDEHLILAEVASRLGVSRDQARALERRGALPARRVVSAPPSEMVTTPTPYLIDLNEVVPLGWPVLNSAMEVTGKAVCMGMGSS